jgi:hypothetical protein
MIVKAPGSRRASLPWRPPTAISREDVMTQCLKLYIFGVLIRILKSKDAMSIMRRDMASFDPIILS